ncbi:hypothetical protein [Catenulispora rubra]|uniref:hypothetical protein n=1 Tax=Catenulispora rubra TaxID=280293 RepID=UPI00189279E7|nr:hypothetical protein [Catenulispora rubra]
MNDLTTTENTSLALKNVTVLVNRQPVVLHSRDVTGAQIKRDAIEQGVTTVKPDSRLFHKVGDSWVLVPDGETVRAHENEKFRAQGRQEDS